jgi:hypothetical protein
MLLILGAIYAACYFRFQGRLSVQEMAVWLQAASAVVVFYQFNLTIWLVPIYVAGGIAAERERTALGDLLTTRLSSADIVLGKLAAGLAQFATNLAIGFPAMSLVPFIGGVDPGIVLLACVGIVSTAFFVGGLSILVSTGCRRNGQAMRTALSLTGAWLILPTMAWAFLGPAMPRLWQWIHPIKI